jgi:hypothetical protein
MVIVERTVRIDYLRGAENSETRWLDGHWNVGGRD